MVPVADSFLLGRCENSKNILTSLIPQILTAAPAERSFLKRLFSPHSLSLSLSVIVTNTDHDIGHSWKYSTVNEGQYRVALEKETGTNAGWLQSYMTIILFIILETGWGRQRGSWEVTGSWRSHSYALCVRLSVCVCLLCALIVHELESMMKTKLCPWPTWNCTIWLLL